MHYELPKAGILIDIIALICTSEKKMPNFRPFSAASGNQNGDFRTFLDFEKLKCFRTLEWYFRKQLTIEAIWGKFEEIRNFAIVISFSVFTETGS